MVLLLELGGDERLRLRNLERELDLDLILSLVLAIEMDNEIGGDGDIGEPQSTLSRRPPSEAVRYSSSDEKRIDFCGVIGVIGLVTLLLFIKSELLLLLNLLLSCPTLCAFIKSFSISLLISSVVLFIINCGFVSVNSFGSITSTIV